MRSGDEEGSAALDAAMAVWTQVPVMNELVAAGEILQVRGGILVFRDAVDLDAPEGPETAAEGCGFEGHGPDFCSGVSWQGTTVVWLAVWLDGTDHSGYAPGHPGVR